MKERPILFSGEMVRAILDGRKTMTRRAVKRKDITLAEKRGIVSGTGPAFGLCPFGQPGDRLWVRETWRHTPDGPRYRADLDQGDFQPWKPSIFMPRRFSRLLLEVTAVQAERVQDISEEDAEAEGVRGCCPTTFTACPCGGRYARDKFTELWDSLNAKRGYGWIENPWVWIISFKVVKP